MQGWQEFCDRCCEIWSLPRLPRIDALIPQPIVRARCGLPHSVEDTPAASFPEWCWEWGDERVNRTVFLVDCQPLASIIGGHMALTDGYLRQPFARMARNLKIVFQSQWWPRRDRCDYVCWAPRRFNASADHLANVALDESGALRWEDDAIAPGVDAWLVVSSDGGFRGCGGSAAAWIVWKLHSATKTADPLAMWYTFWRDGRSAFETEVVALDSALEYCVELIRSRVS